MRITSGVDFPRRNGSCLCLRERSWILIRSRVSNTGKANRVTEKVSWKQYEAYIFNRLRADFPSGEFAHDVRITGIRTGRLRQIDVLIRSTVAGYPVAIAIDCKCFRRKVSVKDVEAFLGLLEDVRVSKGIMVTTKGYSDTAVKRAANAGSDLQLEIREFEYLSEYQMIGGAVAWYGPLAIIVRTHHTWLIDNEPTESPFFHLFCSYPIGRTRESALAQDAYIYGNVVRKNTGLVTLESVVEEHNNDIRRRGPRARIEYLEAIDRAERTIVRKAFVHERYLGHEYSVYIDHKKAVFLLVLLCPNGRDDELFPVLSEMAHNAILLQCTEEAPADRAYVEVEGEHGGMVSTLRVHRLMTTMQPLSRSTPLPLTRANAIALSSDTLNRAPLWAIDGDPAPISRPTRSSRLSASARDRGRRRWCVCFS